MTKQYEALNGFHQTSAKTLGLNPSQKHVLAVMTAYMDSDLKTTYVGQGTVADCTGMSRATVNKAYNHLEQTGFIKHVGENVRYKTRVYRLNVDKMVIKREYANDVVFFEDDKPTPTPVKVSNTSVEVAETATLSKDVNTDSDGWEV